MFEHARIAIVLSAVAAASCASETPDPSDDTETTLSMTVDGPRGRLEIPYRLIDGYAVAGGDMILATPEQRAQRGLGNRRGVKQWSKGIIPYEIDSEILPAQRAEIRAAMDAWELLTDIRFIERSGESDYVEFVSDDNLCWSEIGRVSGRQKVKLRKGCGASTTRHELGHTIGLLHEHQRPDRGDFVQFHSQCTDHPGDFEPFDDDAENETIYGAYDYASVMHYGTRCLGENHSPAPDQTNCCPDLLHKNGTYLYGDGNISAGDVQAVQSMYRDERRVHIGIEAESGTLTWPMRTRLDESSSAGWHIWVPNGGGSGGRAQYTFSAPHRADYYVWGRVFAPTPNDDSFYVSVDSTPRTRWNTPRIVDGTWTWGRAPLPYTLGYGTHTLNIDQREDGTRLDRIILTDDPNWQPYEAWIAGEDALFESPMRADSFDGAIDGRAAHLPSWSVNDVGAAYYDFYAPATERYTVRARVYSRNNGDNSFYFSLDDDPPASWHTTVGSTFLWQQVAPARPDYLLRQGTHLMTLGGRESGTVLDEILVTNDPGFAPASIAALPQGPAH